MRWPQWWPVRRRYRGLDGRLVAARAQENLSRDRLETARREVVEPLTKLARENQFADLIQASLRRGHGGRA